MNLLNFFAQLLVLFAVIAFYEVSGRRIGIGPKIFALPGIVLAMALLALGLGCLIASATVKYRDLNMVVGYTSTFGCSPASSSIRDQWCLITCNG
jgi:lipopolysaccharide transport system permease protein